MGVRREGSACQNRRTAARFPSLSCGDTTVRCSIRPEMKSFVIRNVFRADPQADGRPGSLRNDLQDVRIAAGRFVEWAPAGALQARDSIDGGGQFLTPGLIDCHCHLCGVFLPKIPSLLDMRWIPRQIATNLRAHLASGVTTMRDMGAPLRLILHLRQRATAPTSGFPAGLAVKTL